jgi:hypothetical protein
MQKNEGHHLEPELNRIPQVLAAKELSGMVRSYSDTLMYAD